MNRQEEELQARERVDDFAVENCWEDLAMPKLAHWLSGSAISIPTHGENKSFCSLASCLCLLGTIEQPGRNSKIWPSAHAKN